MRVALLALTLACLAGPALADRIDGSWCDPKGAASLTIDGPRITTPGGHRISGDYSRHFFVYTVPKGEPGEGARVEMRLLSEDEVEVLQGESFATWRRCQLNS